MDKENGNIPAPQLQIQTQQGLAAMLQADAAGINTMAINLAWLVKHPGADMVCTQQQLNRRGEWFQGLAEDVQVDWGAKAGEYILFILGRLALVPEIQKLVEPSRILTLPPKLPPGMPKLPGSGGE